MSENTTNTQATHDLGGDKMFVAFMLLILALWSLFTAARAADPLMGAHAMMFLLAALAGGFAFIIHMSSASSAGP